MSGMSGEGEKVWVHGAVLQAGTVRLRPLTEDDWELVVGWWNDPEIAYYADSNEGAYSLAQVQGIVRGISRTAFCFVIEFESRPVGECWLQEMNVERVLRRYPGLDCRRIDIEIEKAFWGRGIGTAAIRLLVEFGFETEGADAVFAMDVAGDNPGSRQAFEKAGFELYDTVEQPAGARASLSHDLAIWKQAHRRKAGRGVV